MSHASRLPGRVDMTTATQDFTGTFTADQVHSSFLFAVRHMKVSRFRATFGDVDARVEGGESGISLEGRARVTSISITAPPEFREHVVNGEEFFDGRNHPEIVFRSTRVELAEDGGLAVDGELEIKGIARPVTATGTYQFPVEDPYGASRAAIELRAVVDRRDWDMSWQMPLPGGGEALGYEVELTVHLELVRQG
jgi:polyisoprenoid-binding protein YceI